MRLPGFPGMILIRAGKKLWSRQELIAGSLETARRTAFLWRSCGPRRSSGLLWTILGGSTNWSLCWMTASGRCGDERRQRWPGFRNRMRIASFGLLTGSAKRSPMIPLMSDGTWSTHSAGLELPSPYERRSFSRSFLSAWRIPTESSDPFRCRPWGAWRPGTRARSSSCLHPPRKTFLRHCCESCALPGPKSGSRPGSSTQPGLEFSLQPARSPGRLKPKLRTKAHEIIAHVWSSAFRLHGARAG